MRELKFEYYALRADFNNKKVEQFNIFDNSYVYDCTVKAVVRYMSGAIKYDDYVKEIRSCIMHEMWARVQYEMAMGDLFVNDMNKLHKIDVFTQVEKNIPVIAMYVYMTAKDYFYNEDVMNTEIKPEALRDHVWVDTCTEKCYSTKEEALQNMDLDETDGDRIQYENWFIKEYISKY